MHPAWRAFRRTVRAISVVTGNLSGVLILVSCIAITNEVVWRYFLHQPHTWNLEFNVFLLVAATFLAANYTQMKRSHVGTEVLETLMSPCWNRWRMLAGDALSLLLCGFLSVKVWEYTAQAWREGWTTDSVWAPHLWIPFALIALGLTLISLEYIVQIVDEVVYPEITGAQRGRA